MRVCCRGLYSSLFAVEIAVEVLQQKGETPWCGILSRVYIFCKTKIKCEPKRFTMSLMAHFKGYEYSFRMKALNFGLYPADLDV